MTHKGEVFTLWPFAEMFPEPWSKARELPGEGRLLSFQSSLPTTRQLKSLTVHLTATGQLHPLEEHTPD